MHTPPPHTRLHGPLHARRLPWLYTELYTAFAAMVFALCVRTVTAQTGHAAPYGLTVAAYEVAWGGSVCLLPQVEPYNSVRGTGGY
jgi:hypothetical protein